MRIRFDRGTIVLEGADADADADLPGIRWDGRIGAHRAPAYLWPQIREAIVRRTGRPPDAVRYVGQPVAPWRELEPLRPYQESALVAWQLAGRRGVVVLPTGSGKTHVAMAAIARAGLSTLCLVPTRVLLDQWQSALAARSTGVVGRLGDGAQQIEPVTVATFAGAYHHMQRLGNRFEVLVVDEVHHFGGGMQDEVLEMSTAGARLGLTATPRGGDGRDRLDELVGPVVYQRTVAELAGSFLAPFEIVAVRVPLDADERLAYDGHMSRFRAAYAAFQQVAPGASWESFSRHATRTAEGRAAIAAWREARRITGYTRGKRAALAHLLARHCDARVLVFTGDNDAAYAVAREHLIAPITCHIGRAERADLLDRFRRGELRALVSARVLNEGVDVPDAEVAIVVDGRMGEREHVQRVGRVLRPAAGKQAVIYELVATGTSESARSVRRRGALATRPAADLAR
jgi:superfamily II DNA or RNA helicase